MTRKFETLNFDLDNGRGDLLSARLEMPLESPPKGFGIFASCFTCEKEFFAPKRISRALAERSIAMVRFDFTGLGKSKGNFSNTNFTTNIDDLRAIADKIKKEYSEDICLLVGHSFGGASSIGLAAERPSVRAVATIGAPKDPRHVMRHFEKNAQILEREGHVEITVAGRTYLLKKQFTEDLKSHDIEKKTRALKAALFVFHDPQDDVVDFQNAPDIFERGTAEKYLIKLENAGHMAGDIKQAQLIAGILSDWLVSGIAPDSEISAYNGRASA